MPGPCTAEETEAGKKQCAFPGALPLAHSLRFSPCFHFSASQDALNGTRVSGLPAGLRDTSQVKS